MCGQLEVPWPAGRGGKGRADFPKQHLTVLMAIDTDASGQARLTEQNLEKGRAERLLAHLQLAGLVPADRHYCGLPLWSQVVAPGTDCCGGSSQAPVLPGLMSGSAAALHTRPDSRLAHTMPLSVWECLITCVSARWACRGSRAQLAEPGNRSSNRIANCPIAAVQSIGRFQRIPAFRIAR